MKYIAVINYETGNIKSIVNALESQKIPFVITSNSDQLENSVGMILPGVGAFSHGMDKLKQLDLDKAIVSICRSGKPLLGICLGMQMLFDVSEEFGETKGLSLIPGRVLKLSINNQEEKKLPHVSWNELTTRDVHQDWKNTILEGIEDKTDFYFVHSYYVNPENKNCILSSTTYSNNKFCSSAKHGNIYGCQFHPEKSGESGLKVLSNFYKLCVEYCDE